MLNTYTFCERVFFLCYFGKSFFSFFLFLSKLFSQRHDFRNDKKKKKGNADEIILQFHSPSSQPHGCFFILYFLHYLLVLLLLINLIKRKVNWKLRNILSKLILNWIKFMFKWKKGMKALYYKINKKNGSSGWLRCWKVV